MLRQRNKPEVKLTRMIGLTSWQLGAATPDPRWNKITHICIATQHALHTEGSLNGFSLYIKGTKKLDLCLIVLISLFQVKCTFFMVFADIRSNL